MVAMIPEGRATTYGLLAEAARYRTGAGGARQVGALLARYGAGESWWRVVRADGTLPTGLAHRARPHYEEEGTALRPDGSIDFPSALWDPLTDA